MPDQLTLPVCVLPGCTTPVAEWAEPCDGCRTAFGPRLRAATGPAMTEADIDARDSGVRHAYALQRATRKATA